MTIAERIDKVRSESPHPIDTLIGSAAEFVFVVRHGDYFRWINSADKASAETPLEFTRIGTNLYNHVTGESWGAPLDIDGASHGALTPAQLAEVESLRPAYVTLSVTSTSGTGRHWWILWDKPVPCSPAEHRLLGKRAAAKLKADVNLPYEWIDVSTNILWTVARDAGKGAFVGTPTDGRLSPDGLPPMPSMPGRPDEPPPTLNDACRQFMERATGFACAWIPEIGAIRLHKGLLLELQKFYPGNFQTNCRCTDPTTANCWMRWAGDHWDVYCWQDAEHESWDKTPGGWSHTTFGKAPSFDKANLDGIPESDNCYRYTDDAKAIEAIRQLTGETFTVPECLRTAGRQFDVFRKGNVYQLRAHKNRSAEPCPEAWCDAKGYFWLGARAAEVEDSTQSLKRQFYQTRQDKRLTGMFRYTGAGVPVAHRREEAYAVARHQLGSEGTAFIDDVTAHPVELVCEAFQPVLQPGKLNIGPNFVVKPEPGRCPTWMKMLARLGDSLTPALMDPDAPWAAWVRKHRVTTGGRWILLWIAWIVQDPKQRLPILTLVGGRDVGKSTLGDALQRLWDRAGTSDAGELLRTRSQFTGNVAQSVLGRIEDCDISRKDQLLRLTPWVTSPRLLCEHKNQPAYHVDNQVHFLVETNNPKDIPIHDKDCRFVVSEVAPLKSKDVDFAAKLDKEAGAFLHFVLNLALPERYSRLALPDVVTDAKAEIAETNRSEAEVFADECIRTAIDAFLSNPQLFDGYRDWCHNTDRSASITTAQELVRELSGWFTARGIAPERRKENGRLYRGRRGVKIDTDPSTA